MTQTWVIQGDMGQSWADTDMGQPRADTDMGQSGLDTDMGQLGADTDMGLPRAEVCGDYRGLSRHVVLEFLYFTMEFSKL